MDENLRPLLDETVEEANHFKTNQKFVMRINAHLSYRFYLQVLQEG